MFAICPPICDIFDFMFYDCKFCIQLPLEVHLWPHPRHEIYMKYIWLSKNKIFSIKFCPKFGNEFFKNNNKRMHIPKIFSSYAPAKRTSFGIHSPFTCECVFWFFIVKCWMKWNSLFNCLLRLCSRDISLPQRSKQNNKKLKIKLKNNGTLYTFTEWLKKTKSGFWCTGAAAKCFQACKCPKQVD